MWNLNEFYDLWFEVSYGNIVHMCVENGLPFNDKTFKKLFKIDVIDYINNINS